MTRCLRQAAVLALAPASVALAHAGHGQDVAGQTVQHYLTESEHLASLAGGLIVLVIGGVLWRLSRRAADCSS